jgi:hypothetical protein
MELEGAVASGRFDREAFGAFLVMLADDLRADPQGWENVSLEGFLRAWSGWVADMDGYFENLGEPTPAEPSWQLVARMLLAAKVYE